jgi:predicted transcriptional regulator
MESENEAFNLEDLPTFLLYVLDEVELVCREQTTDLSKLESHLIVVDKVVRLLRELSLPGVYAILETNDLEHLKALSDVFADILSAMQQLISTLSVTPATVAENVCVTEGRNPGEVGRPKFCIQSEVLEDLRSLGFSWTKIAMMLGVSRWTISRRVKDYGLEDMCGFSQLSNEELDRLVRNYIDHHGTTSGQTYIIGYIKSLGYHVQRSRIRECLARLDPRNTALRWGVTVSRRVYSVPWPNSLWHLDGHHSLIRWKLVIHGCIDGFSRRIMFLKCSSNNLAETVLTLFLEAIDNDSGLWPSRICVDRGVENVLVCEAIEMARGEGRGSFIPGPSTHNQRIERLWRDVYRCVCHMYYYVFTAWKCLEFLTQKIQCICLLYIWSIFQELIMP